VKAFITGSGVHLPDNIVTNNKLAARLGLDPAQIFKSSGISSSASVGIALDKLLRSGRICDGDYVLMPAFAAGFTWGAALCRA
jgi:3-oxoacyl-[acyl-carrier-protein] synthase-3